ncbi:hypothetical protein [Streptomyces sp. YGL11-2]|uniref:hypothetical protein n=1 Tax=Streptomyces sp. YGL11-2 TaxID=3414028 RepID=UPI003CF0175E
MPQSSHKSNSTYDACFVDPYSEGDLYLFKGDQVCKVDSASDKRRQEPQKISQWRSQYPFSDGIDACFVDPYSKGDLYLFRGDQVCKVDSASDKRRQEPQKISQWRSQYPFSDGIDACFVDPYSKGDLYLFRGDQVCKVDSASDKRRQEPQKISQWRSQYPFSDGIDACFVDPYSKGDLYLFRGDQVCKVDSASDKRRQEPQKISQWRSQYPFLRAMFA